MKLGHLSLVTLILFFISLGVFYQDTQRGKGTIEGSSFLKGLNIAGVSKITFKPKSKEEITFLKNGDHFILESHKSFPAENTKVNDLLFKLSNLKIKEKVASELDDEELESFELGSKNSQYEIKLYDEKGDFLSGFKIGKSWKGKGRYLLKESTGEVFLSTDNVWFSSSFDSFISKTILELKSDDIKSVRVSGKTQFSFSLEDDKVKVEGEGAEKVKQDKSKEYLRSLNRLSFEKYFNPGDKEVSQLRFDEQITLETVDKRLLVVELAKKGADYFARAKATVNEQQSTFVVRQDDDAEKLMEIDNLVKSQGAAQKFNQERGAWVYKISKSEYDNWSLEAKELL